VARELCTPTGAGILAALVTSWGAAPPLITQAVGYGAGDLDLPDRPNLLRAVVGRPHSAATGPTAAAPAEGGLYVVEANLDDMNPELAEHVSERLFAVGAVDVWFAPVTMKKSRPAFVLGALAPPPVLDAVCEVILAETTTIGVRYHAAARRVLERRIDRVETPWGAVDVKIALGSGRVLNVAPEYESCRALARSQGVPLKDVYAAAAAAWHRR
jgi:uncharacterized protein (DUF111 family)